MNRCWPAAALRGYVERALELERQQGEPDGVFTGLMAINPANGARVPIWLADYVLASYGTGAIMGVPAHGERDARFAAKYGLASKESALFWAALRALRARNAAQKRVIFRAAKPPKTTHNQGLGLRPKVGKHS